MRVQPGRDCAKTAGTRCPRQAHHGKRIGRSGRDLAGEPLLVIDLRLPPVPAGTEDAPLLRALLDVWPKLTVFVFTFFIRGMTWLGHHRKFS